MRRTEIEQQRNELIERLRQVRSINPRANPLYRKALGLLTRTWMRTPGHPPPRAPEDRDVADRYRRQISDDVAAKAYFLSCACAPGFLSCAWPSKFGA